MVSMNSSLTTTRLHRDTAARGDVVGTGGASTNGTASKGRSRGAALATGTGSTATDCNPGLPSQPVRDGVRPARI